MLAVIGGTGLTQLSNLEVLRRQVVRTPYGEPSGAITLGRIGEVEAMFLARHGYGHTIPPHLVNYRANVWALRDMGADGIVSIASVGGIRADLGPGTLLVPDQVVDYTWGRRSTFFESTDRAVVHIDFTEPYDRNIRRRLLDAGLLADVDVLDGGVYAAMQGPRLETAAEINRLERDGADVVGMTGMPEAALARELEIPYAALAVVSNYAAGRGDNRHHIEFAALEAVLQESMGKVKRIIEQVCQAC